MISLVAAALVLRMQRPVPPPVDRSGEPTLKRLMDGFASLQDADIVLSIDSQQDGVESYYQMPFRFEMKSNTIYQLSISGMWGDQAKFVSDGKAFLYDANDDSVPITLRDANKPLYDLSDQLSPNGGYGSPLWYFLDGSRSFDKLVDPKQPVIEVKAEEPCKAVQFGSSGFGTVTVYYVPGRAPEVVGFSFDNLPFLKRMHEQDPDDFPEPQNAVTRQMLSVRRLRGKKGMFSAEPLKGHEVDDQRKKGS